ncbi:MAG: hypothetical protein ABIO72_01185 [Patescibacteria group bacterium]
MTFRMYLVLMTIATILSWGAWVLVLNTTNPQEAGTGGFVIFFVTLLLSLVGTLTLFGTAYRVLFLRRSGVMAREVRVAFRHAVFLSIAAILALFLSAQGWLSWWALLLLLVTMSAVEYVFLLREESRRS